MSLLECTALRKSYRRGAGPVPALNGVDLAVERGEFVAVAGPSGSGKTTLLNLLGGLDRPDAGDVVLDGRSLGALTEAALSELRLRRIGFVFQAHNLIPVLSAQENVEFVMLLQGVPRPERRRRAGAMLERVGLAGLHDRRPAEMSGGQQQRVAVARAIVTNPAVVLADEPTANLDSHTGRALLETMLAMNRDLAVTFVLATHDPMVMDLAGRLVRIRDGRLDGVAVAGAHHA